VPPSPPRTTPPRSSRRESRRPEAWCLARSLRLLGDDGGAPSRGASL
jgi:hypothetical protein